MLKNMLNRLIIFLTLFVVVVCFVQCAKTSTEKRASFDHLDSLKKVEDSSRAVTSNNTFTQSEKLNFSYNDSTAILSFVFNEQKFVLGEYRNTFGIAPDIETKQVDSLVYIIIINKFFDLGQGFDVLTVYLFDRKQNNLKKEVETEEIGLHDMSNDTLRNIKYYNYRIEKQNLIIEEYTPYKSLDNKNHKYQTMIQNYPFIK